MKKIIYETLDVTSNLRTLVRRLYKNTNVLYNSFTNHISVNKIKILKPITKAWNKILLLNNKTMIVDMGFVPIETTVILTDIKLLEYYKKYLIMEENILLEFEKHPEYSSFIKNICDMYFNLIKDMYKEIKVKGGFKANVINNTDN